MTQKRKRCDKQFKIAAARVVLGGEMRAVDLARELGIKDSTLRRWAQEHGGRARAPSPKTAARRSTRITRSRSSAKGSRSPSARTGQETIEEAIIETYLTDASTRRIEDFAESKG